MGPWGRISTNCAMAVFRYDRKSKYMIIYVYQSIQQHVKGWFVFTYSPISTHWGRVTNICISNLTIIGSDNGLAPGQCQAIIWINAGVSLIALLGTNFSAILIESLTFLFKKMHLKISSGKWQPFCLGLNVLRRQDHRLIIPEQFLEWKHDKTGCGTHNAPIQYKDVILPV